MYGVGKGYTTNLGFPIKNHHKRYSFPLKMITVKKNRKFEGEHVGLKLCRKLVTLEARIT